VGALLAIAVAAAANAVAAEPPDARPSLDPQPGDLKYL
jgi:hypothetical protein